MTPEFTVTSIAMGVILAFGFFFATVSSRMVGLIATVLLKVTGDVGAHEMQGAIAIAFEVIGISSLTVAIGLYLPLELSSTIMIGGIIRMIVDKKKSASDKAKK